MIRMSTARPESRSRLARLARRATLVSVACLLIAGCQPLGPRAELGLGWFRDIGDLARLEEVFVHNGFQPELQDYLSAESAAESVQPWRYKSDGVIYSYFTYPSGSECPMRAILHLSGMARRLGVLIGGRDACPDRGFLKEDRERLDQLEREIGQRFNRRANFRYVKSERC